MKKFLLLTIFPLLLFLMTSCSMDQKVHFNDDNSGTYSLSLDMGGMMDMMKSMDGDKDSGEDEGEKKEEKAEDDPLAQLDELDSIWNTTAQMPGVTNFKSSGSKDEGKIGFGFDFDQMGTLNSYLSGMGGDDAAEKTIMDFFTTKKSEVKFNSAGFDKLMGDFNKSDGKDDGSKEMMEGMAGMFKMGFEVSFDKEIVKLKGDNVEQIGKNTVRIKDLMGGIKEGKGFNDFSVKLK